MRYYIISEEEGAQSAPVGSKEAQYLLKVLPTLKLLSLDKYAKSFAGILHTAARYSYVIHENAVLWCIEWDPGLLVLCFRNNEISFSSIRSPVPGFGGRPELDSEWDDYDEDEDDHQYKIVFSSWDSRFDPSTREYYGFLNASESEIALVSVVFEWLNSIDVPEFDLSSAKSIISVLADPGLPHGDFR